MPGPGKVSPVKPNVCGIIYVVGMPPLSVYISLSSAGSGVCAGSIGSTAGYTETNIHVAHTSTHSSSMLHAVGCRSVCTLSDVVASGVA